MQLWQKMWFSSSGVGAQGGHDEEDGELSGELQEEVRCHEAPTGTTVFWLPQGQKSKERERERDSQMKTSHVQI